MEEVGYSSMAASSSNSVTWEEIELSESYLVCSMFEEAAALATSILTRIHEDKCIGTEDKILLHDMMASAAMVLVQSWRESGRTSNLLDELESYFGSATSIPVQVLLTSACVQVSAGHSSKVRDFLVDFLGKWQFDNEKYCVFACPDAGTTDMEVCDWRPRLEVDQYLKVVEFYALTLLGTVLNDLDHAILWVEKDQLPEEARQDLLRRLVSLYPLKSTSSSQEAVSSSLAEESELRPLSLKEVKQSDKPRMVLKTQCHSGGLDGKKRSIWARLQNITKRSCNAVVASKGKIFLGVWIFLICYFIRKKRDTIKRAVQRRAMWLKQALVDVWQLAFSYQVNPLAAVQALPTTTRGS